jgi:hypothetical protein
MPRRRALGVAIGAAVTFLARAAGAQWGSQGGLRQGGAVMQLGGYPLALTGPETHLTMSEGTLTGTIYGRRVDAKLADGRVRGVGPDGSIDLTLEESGGELHVRGDWNGHPVDLTFSAQGITGRATKRESSTGVAVDTCRYDITPAPGSVATGLADCLRAAEPRRVELRPAKEVLFTRPDAALLLVAFLTTPR